MKKLVSVTIVGTFAFLASAEAVCADTVDVSVTCPESWDRNAPRTLSFTVRNKLTSAQTIERFAIGYIGNTIKSGAIVSGPFNVAVGPITLASLASRNFDIQFPPVPTIYPSGTVIAGFGAIYNKVQVLGKGVCPAPVPVQ